MPILNLQGLIDGVPPPASIGLAEQGSGTITIPPGIWTVPGTVTVPSYVKLTGAGGSFGQGGLHIFFSKRNRTMHIVSARDQ